jgi:NAD(P)-dependent dehydrogenase (short-subunit alcohol dehydrogenase family)
MRILVTGAASGIGLATCERLVADGDSVAGLDVTSGGAATVVADVIDRVAVRDAVAEAAETLGGLDGIVNAAGIGGWTGDVVRTDPAEWERVLAVDLTGPFHVCAETIPHLRSAGGGAIVNVSSQFGLIGCAGSPAYVAAKAGLVGLTKALALDHADDGIRVNCVCPGPVDTPMYRASRDEDATGLGDRERARSEGRVPLGRIGRPEEIAATIAFLLRDDASYLTGAVVAVDGGWTAG